MKPNHGSVSLGNGNAGNGGRAAGQIHVDGASLVVADHTGQGPGVGGCLMLLIEGGAAPGYENNLSFYGVAEGRKILRRAKAVYPDVVIVAGEGGEGCVRIAVGRGIRIEHRIVSN